MDRSIIESISFEVFKYEVYYSYWDEKEVIIPEDRWGFILDDVPGAEYTTFDTLSNMFPDHYIFTRNKEYDCLDVYILCNTNKDIIQEYIEENQPYHILYPGDVVSYGGVIFPIQDRITLVDTNKIPLDIRRVIDIELDSGKESISEGYIDSIKMYIDARSSCTINISFTEKIFPIYVSYCNKNKRMMHIDACENLREEYSSYKQYVRGRYLMQVATSKYVPTASLFLSISYSHCDIDITCCR